MGVRAAEEVRSVLGVQPGAGSRGTVAKIEFLQLKWKQLWSHLSEKIHLGKLTERVQE